MANVALGLAVGFATNALLSFLQPEREGSRLSDLSAPKSNYGVALPWVWGRVRVGGNIIWATDLEEKKKKKRGGKGGRSQTNYQYFGNFAVALAECPFRPIVSIPKVWLSSKLVYNAEGNAATVNNGNSFASDYMRFYYGTATQTVDPLIAAKKPTTSYDLGLPEDPIARAQALAILKATYNITETTPIQTPAYRHRSMLVFERLPLNDFNNAIPQTISAELVGSNNCTVAQILTDLLTAKGYLSSQFDVANVPIPVTGFWINQVTSLKDAIEQLKTAYFFDLRRSDGKLVFIPESANRTIVQISAPYLDSREGSEQGGKPREEEIAPAEDLPSEVALTYLDKDLSYSENTIYARSQTAKNNNQNQQTYSLPIVLTASEAATIADRLLFKLWASRKKFKFNLPPAHSALEAADWVTIPYGEENLLCKLTRVHQGANFLIKCEAEKLDQTVATFSRQITAGYTTNITVSPGQTYTISGATAIVGVANATNGTVYTQGVDYNIVNNQVVVINGGAITSNTSITVLSNAVATQPQTETSVTTPGNTTLRVLDIPLVSDSDSELGIYVTGTGGENWTGASVYVSSDNSRYELATLLESDGTFGTATSVLSSGGDSVSVTLLSGELESVTENDLNAGLNKALLGNEIIQFRTATLTATNAYTLSNLRRGRRGTEEAQGTHANGERFILLTGSDAYIERVPGYTSDIGQVRYFKAPSDGQALGGLTATSLTVAGNSLRPYSPVNLAATRDQGGNMRLSWTRRDRKAGDRTDYAAFPMSEQTESYQIEVMQGATVRRTLTATTATVTYTAAQQVSDFGSTQSSITFRVYQMSALVGRGSVATATITPALINQIPTITSFTPIQGQAGETVTISGATFTGASAVRVNGVSATFTVVSDSSITLTVPTLERGGTIEVVNASLTGVSPYPFILTQRNEEIITVSASRSLAASDLNKILNCTNSGAITLTLNASLITNNVGFKCAVRMQGTGAITFVVSGGTLEAVGNKLTIRYTAAYLAFVGNSTWIALGALTS